MLSGCFSVASGRPSQDGAKRDCGSDCSAGGGGYLATILAPDSTSWSVRRAGLDPLPEWQRNQRRSKGLLGCASRWGSPSPLHTAAERDRAGDRTAVMHPAVGLQPGPREVRSLPHARIGTTLLIRPSTRAVTCAPHKASARPRSARYVALL